MAYYADKAIIQKDHYKLDGKTYGLMFYDRDVFGNAMMSSAKGSSALSVLETLTKVNPITHSGVNFISLDNDISMWTFHSVEKDIYTISTETDQGVACELRSRWYNINPIAVKYGGGGHQKASGATLKNREEAMRMLADLDQMAEENA